MAVIVHAGSDPLSLTAIDRAVEEAELRTLPVVLVSQVDMPRAQSAAATFESRRDETGAQGEAQAAELQSRGVTCLPYMPSAPLSRAEAVLQAARDHDAELVVIGARRRTSVGKALFGSWAQEIVLNADCPVLVVKLSPEQEDAL